MVKSMAMELIFTTMEIDMKVKNYKKKIKIYVIYVIKLLRVIIFYRDILIKKINVIKVIFLLLLNPKN